MRTRAVAGAVALTAALAAAVAGCGPTDNAELKRRIQAVNAIAVEGRLLADGVIGDRTKATFARVHGRTLAEAAEHEAEKMADADVLERLEPERARAVGIAQRVSGAISVLQVFPGGEDNARGARNDLVDLAREAQRLDSSIPEQP
jgi:hypothetical protein